MTSPFRDEDRPRAPLQPDAPQTVVGRHGQSLLSGVHAHLRHELTQVLELVRRAAEDPAAAPEARARVQELAPVDPRLLGAFCSRYCSVVDVHHRIEDAALFPDLAQADPTLVPVLERLSQEHVVVHEALLTVDAALVALLRGEDGARERLEGEVSALSAALLDHLAYEERELLPALGRLEVRV